MKNLLVISCLLLFSAPVFAGRSCSISPLQFSCSDAFGNKKSFQDGGCSVSCGILQNAVCRPASCDSFFGGAHPSSCNCERMLNSQDELEEEKKNEKESEEFLPSGFEVY